MNRTRGLHMTSDIVFSLILSQLSEIIPLTKRITSETLPKPLSAVPRISGKGFGGNPFGMGDYLTQLGEHQTEYNVRSHMKSPCSIHGQSTI